MTSKNKNTRIEQIDKVKKLYDLRKAELEKNESTADEIKKDKILKHLKAELRRAKNAVAAIDKREQIILDAKKLKAERAAKPAESKKSKKEPEPKAEPKSKKKQKKSE